MNAQQVWQTQGLEAPRISLAYAQHGASSIERRIRRGNAMAYVACVLGCGWWGFNAWRYFSARPLMLAALAGYAFFALYCIYRQHRHAAAEPTPVDAGVLDTLNFLRRQFERQRDWLRGSGRWVPLAVLPGFLCQLASMYLDISPVPWAYISAFVLLMSGGLGTAALLGERRARRFQHEIDALDSLNRGE